MIATISAKLGRLALIGSLLALASCGPEPHATPADTSRPEPRPDARLGKLEMRVLWPAQQSAMATRSIPDSTATVSLTVKNANNYVMGSATVTRSTGQMSVVASALVAVGSNYSVIAEARNGGGSALAQGTAAGVSVTENTTSNVNIAMGALSAPTITAFSQANGGPGASITLTGTNFGYSAGASLQVYFNATANTDNTVTGTQAATVNRTSDVSITATVPAGATNGNVIVRVDGIPSASTANFIVIQSISVSPTTPTVDVGATQAFTASATDTSSAAVSNPVVTWTSSDTAVGTITSGGVLTGVKGGTTTVTAASGNVSGNSAAAVRPVISSLSPANGPPGAALTVNGTGFGASQGSSTVTVGGAAASVTSWSGSSVAVTVPALAVGSASVVVTVGGQASAGQTFTARPDITSLSPSTGIAGGSVTISGSLFGATQGASTLSIGGTNASVTSWSDTSLTATVPASLTPGNAATVVTVSGVASNSANYTVRPNVSAVSPTTGSWGASVTIDGANFGSTQGSSTLKFNGTAATTITSWSGAQIIAKVPNGAMTGGVVVRVNGIDSNGGTFVVNASITSLSPACGAMGTSVTVNGGNFGATQGTSTIKFNGTTASPSAWGDTQIRATVPTGATTGNVVVAVNSLNSNGVSYTVASNCITSLSPTSGSIGQTITINGSGFGSFQGSSTIKFNGTTATTVTQWNSTQLKAVVPSGATTGNVVVRVNGTDSNGMPFTVQ